MSHKKLRPFIVKVSVLGYFPLPRNIRNLRNYSTFKINLKNYLIKL